MKKISKLLKTDFEYIYKNGSVMMASQVGVSLVGFLVTIAFANLLSKESYGTYQYILSIIELILIFSLTGISRAAIVSFAKNLDGTYKKAFFDSLLFALPAIVLGIVVGTYYLLNENITLGLGIALGVVAMQFITSFKLYISLLNGKKLFHLTALLIFLNILFTGIAVTITIFLTENILYILFAFLGSNLLFNGLFYTYSKKFIQNNVVDTTYKSQSVHISIQGAIGHIAAQADRVLLFQFIGPAALAEFWIAQNVQRQFTHLFKNAKSIVLPKISTRDITTLRKTLFKKVLWLYVIIVPFLFFYWFFTPYIFTYFFPEYQNTIFFAQLFGLVFIFLPFKILGEVFVAHGLTAVLYKITIATSLLRIFTTIIFIPNFGILGAILAILIDQLVHSLAVLWFFFKLKKA